MSHLRTQIRGAVKTALTGLSSTGPRVYQTRYYPAQASALPALLIYTLSETSEVDTLTKPRGMHRVLQLVIEGLATGTVNLDTTLDTIAVEVEEAIALDPTLGGKAKDLTLTNTDITFNAEGEKPVGSIRMTYRVLYRTRENDAETET